MPKEYKIKTDFNYIIVKGLKPNGKKWFGCVKAFERDTRIVSFDLDLMSLLFGVDVYDLIKNATDYKTYVENIKKGEF